MCSDSGHAGAGNGEVIGSGSDRVAEKEDTDCHKLRQRRLLLCSAGRNVLDPRETWIGEYEWFIGGQVDQFLCSRRTNRDVHGHRLRCHHASTHAFELSPPHSNKRTKSVVRCCEEAAEGKANARG